MEFFTSDNLGLFIILFLPGFISIKIYNQIIANERYDFSKNLLEIVGISLFNLAFNSWLIIIAIKFGWMYTQSFAFILSVLWIFLVAPVLYPFALKRFFATHRMKKYFLSPTKQPWDAFFSTGTSGWVVITLHDGRQIGGYYGTKSKASIYPCEESLYIEQVWIIDDKKKFVKIRPRTGGMLLLTKTIQTIEFQL